MDILKHFIWQIKRKLWKKPVKEDIMPDFVGATGAGKSYNLLKLLEPIEELTYQAPSMTMLNDMFFNRFLPELSFYLPNEMLKNIHI